MNPDNRILNKEQKKAVEFGNGPLLIIAGAGTGKTTVITERIKYLISSKKARPEEILALTFTEKASQEMEERVNLALPYGVTNMWISTFHAFCDRVLRADGISIGLNPAYTLLSEAESIQFLRSHLFDLDLSYFRPLGNPNKFIEGILQHFSRLKDEDISPIKYSEWVKLQITNNKSQINHNPPAGEQITNEENEKYSELAGAYQKYEELKVKKGLMDFSDLIEKTLTLFRTRPSVLQRYHEQFKYILIDEFQDTNFAQNELAVLLSGKKKNISVVGDDDQCLPGDTVIATEKGSQIIAKIKKGDAVLTGIGRGYVGQSKVTHVFKKTKNVQMVTIKTEHGKNIKATANHKMFCYVPKSNVNQQYHYVYLMYRKNLGWRLGVTKNFAVRLKLERSSDGIVGLQAFNSEEEARYHELLWSLKYQIPTSIFKERNGVMMQGSFVERLYREIDTERNAQRLASDIGIDIRSFHHVLDGITRGAGKRVVVHLHVCHRRYTAKNAKNRLVCNPHIAHVVYTETSNKDIIQILQKNAIHCEKAKKGVRIRFESVDLKVAGAFADMLVRITGGFLEISSAIGMLHQVHESAVVMPAGNILPGLYIPVRRNTHIHYEKVISVTKENCKETVYDLEIEKTHNFIANDIVVHNSIYRWRGAAVSNIIQFRKRFPKTHTVVLTENYRSTKEILDRSYDLIQKNNPDRLEVLAKIDKKLVCHRRVNGESVHCIIKNRVEDEADGVARAIGDILKNDPTKSYKDVAILVRANAHAEPFTRALSRHGIPYQFLGPGQLLRQPEVKDLMAYLKVLYDINDSVALFRVFSIEELGIDPTDLAAILSFARRQGISLFEASQMCLSNREEIHPSISDKTYGQIEKIMGLIKKHLGLARKESAGQLLYFFVEASGLLSSYLSSNSEKVERSSQNVAKFFDRLKTYEASHEDASVEAVVDYLTLSMDLGESPKASDVDWVNEDAVNILTIHSAKGLEFPIVILVNLVSQRFPTTEKREQIPIPESLIKEVLPQGDAHIEEERRLFYVGMTRARDRLFFTASKFYGEGKREKKISPFVGEALGTAVSFDTQEPESDHQLSILDWEKPVEPVQKKTIRPVTYLSYSQIETFEKCPLQYKYRYILRIPTPSAPALVFGDTIHRTLKDFYEQMKSGTVMTKDMLFEVYDRAWKTGGYQNKKFEEKMKERGTALLKEFFLHGFDPKVQVIDLERSFKVKITPTLTVGGKIDRVDKGKDGQIEIIDYKTGKSPKERKPETDRQLTVYALAACDRGLYGVDPKLVTVSLYFLEDQTKTSAKRTREQLKEIKESIQTIAGEISVTDYTPTPGKQCEFCEFRLICEAWK